MSQDDDDRDGHNPDDSSADDDVAEMEISDLFDVNWFRMEDVEDVVADYLEAAVERGLLEVRILHGKRTGARRVRVHAALAKHPLVVRYADAPRMRTSVGGTLVWLQGSASR